MTDKGAGSHQAGETSCDGQAIKCVENVAPPRPLSQPNLPVNGTGLGTTKIGVVKTPPPVPPKSVTKPKRPTPPVRPAPTTEPTNTTDYQVDSPVISDTLQPITRIQTDLQSTSTSRPSNIASIELKAIPKESEKDYYIENLSADSEENDLVLKFEKTEYKSIELNTNAELGIVPSKSASNERGIDSQNVSSLDNYFSKEFEPVFVESSSIDTSEQSSLESTPKSSPIKHLTEESERRMSELSTDSDLGAPSFPRLPPDGHEFPEKVINGDSVDITYTSPTAVYLESDNNMNMELNKNAFGQNFDDSNKENVDVSEIVSMTETEQIKNKMTEREDVFLENIPSLPSSVPPIPAYNMNIEIDNAKKMDFMEVESEKCHSNFTSDSEESEMTISSLASDSTASTVELITATQMTDMNRSTVQDGLHRSSLYGSASSLTNQPRRSSSRRSSFSSDSGSDLGRIAAPPLQRTRRESVVETLEKKRRESMGPRLKGLQIPSRKSSSISSVVLPKLGPIKAVQPQPKLSSTVGGEKHTSLTIKPIKPFSITENSKQTEQKDDDIIKRPIKHLSTYGLKSHTLPANGNLPMDSTKYTSSSVVSKTYAESTKPVAPEIPSTPPPPVPCEAPPEMPKMEAPTVTETGSDNDTFVTMSRQTAIDLPEVRTAKIETVLAKSIPPPSSTDEGREITEELIRPAVMIRQKSIPQLPNNEAMSVLELPSEDRDRPVSPMVVSLTQHSMITQEKEEEQVEVQEEIIHPQAINKESSVLNMPHETVGKPSVAAKSNKPPVPPKPAAKAQVPTKVISNTSVECTSLMPTVTSGVEVLPKQVSRSREENIKVVEPLKLTMPPSSPSRTFSPRSPSPTLSDVPRPYRRWSSGSSPVSPSTVDPLEGTTTQSSGPTIRKYSLQLNNTSYRQGPQPFMALPSKPLLSTDTNVDIKHNDLPQLDNHIDAHETPSGPTEEQVLPSSDQTISHVPTQDPFVSKLIEIAQEDTTETFHLTNEELKADEIKVSSSSDDTLEVDDDIISENLPPLPSTAPPGLPISPPPSIPIGGLDDEIAEFLAEDGPVESMCDVTCNAGQISHSAGTRTTTAAVVPPKLQSLTLSGSGRLPSSGNKAEHEEQSEGRGSILSSPEGVPLSLSPTPSDADSGIDSTKSDSARAEKG